MFVLNPETKIIDFLHKDGWIKKEGNVFHAEKAFKARAVIESTLNLYAKEKINAGNLFYFFNLLEGFKADAVDFGWKEDGQVSVFRKNDKQNDQQPK